MVPGRPLEGGVCHSRLKRAAQGVGCGFIAGWGAATTCMRGASLTPQVRAGDSPDDVSCAGPRKKGCRAAHHPLVCVRAIALVDGGGGGARGGGIPVQAAGRVVPKQAAPVARAVALAATVLQYFKERGGGRAVSCYSLLGDQGGPAIPVLTRANHLHMARPRLRYCSKGRVAGLLSRRGKPTLVSMPSLSISLLSWSMRARMLRNVSPCACVPWGVVKGSAVGVGLLALQTF